MLRLSWNTFRERWQLFLGSILTVGIGVALVQSSLLVLVAAATYAPPASLSTLERAQLWDDSTVAIPVIGLTLALALFLTVFIISSTFAFTVAQRRKELALLRLVGGSRAQLRRLLLSEATILGLIGTALGVPLGIAVMQLQSGLLVSFDFLPEDFRPQWKWWVLAVSVGIGLVVALGGVLAASRRAGRVRPLDALRGSGDEARVMTPARWFFGVLFLVAATILIIVAQSLDPSGAMPVLMLVALTASIGLSALSPLVVPVFGWIAGLLVRNNPIGTLAAANVRDGVRRNAATASPLIMLVGLVIGLLSTSLALTTASESTLRHDTAADLVATSAADDARRISEVSGVQDTSVEVDVPLVMTNAKHEDDALGGDLQSGDARVVRPDSYRNMHSIQEVAGSLDALHGRAVALGPGRSGELGFSLGDTVDLTIGDRNLQLPVVAVMPMTPYGGPDLLLPEGLTPERVLADASATTFVSTTPGSDSGAIGADIRALAPGTATGVDAWAQNHAAEQQHTQLRIFTVILGMASLYALFSVINAVVIAAASRRSEFAAARLTGLTRRQTVWMAVIESEAVAAIGITLGGVAAAGTILGMGGALQRMTGSGVVELPWATIGGLVTGAFIVVGLTSVLTARAATRTNPIVSATDE